MIPLEIKIFCLVASLFFAGSCVGFTEVEPNTQRPVEKGIYPGVPAPFAYPESGITHGTSCGEYEGSPENWVFVTVDTSDACVISGSYIILENSRIAHWLGIRGHHIVVRDSEVCCDEAGALVHVYEGSSQIVIERNEVHDNGVIPSKGDRHGVRLEADTAHVWILDNHIHHNSGDGIQFCHRCIDRGNGPAHVYISGNEIHDDEENAIDLKEFIGPVVVTCNEMYGYEPMGFSGHGEAFRVNDEGDQGDLWSAHNTYHDNRIDVLPDRSKARSYFLDEKGVVRQGATGVAAGNAAKRYYQEYENRYGISLRDPC